MERSVKLVTLTPEGDAPILSRFQVETTGRGKVFGYKWIWDDGTEGFSIQPENSHVYLTPGVYQPAVEVLWERDHPARKAQSIGRANAVAALLLVVILIVALVLA